MGFSIIITIGLFILLFIAGSGMVYGLKYVEIDDICEGFLLGLLGIATGLLISLLVCGLIIPGIAMAADAETVIVGEEATKLYALKDNSGVSGSFFLGCGNVETDSYIYYITYEDGKGYEVKKQSSNYNVYIDYLTDENCKYEEPVKVKYSCKFKNPILNFFTWGPDGWTTFYVPEGSILENYYSIDLE